MKLLHLLIPVLLSSLCTAAQSVHFEMSLQTTFEKAAQQNKMVFVEYYNADCPVCKKLAPVFSDTALGKFYNTHFVNYKLNTENIKKEDSLFIDHTGLKFESVPWFIFFDSSKHFLHYSGTKPAIDYLINIGNTALNPEERAAALPGKYASGDRSIKTLYAYSNLLQLYKNDSLRNLIADELFNIFPKDQLGSEKSYIITKNCVSTISNGFFIYWIDHAATINTFEKNNTGAHPTHVLADILLKSINSAERKNWDLQQIKKVKAMIAATALSKDPDAFFWEQESTLLVKENQTGKAMDLFRQRIVADSGDINTTVFTIEHFLQLYTDKASLTIIKHSIDQLSLKKITPVEKSKLLYTNILFYKQYGDSPTARKLGQQAVSFYKTNKLDTARLDELIKGL